MTAPVGGKKGAQLSATPARRDEAGKDKNQVGAGPGAVRLAHWNTVVRGWRRERSPLPLPSRTPHRTWKAELNDRVQRYRENRLHKTWGVGWDGLMATMEQSPTQSPPHCHPTQLPARLVATNAIPHTNPSHPPTHPGPQVTPTQEGRHFSGDTTCSPAQPQAGSARRADWPCHRGLGGSPSGCPEIHCAAAGSGPP